MLRINNLSKSYDNITVFKDLNYSFSAGCYVLSEQDSTGKTTLLNIIAGQIKPDAGDVIIAGYSIIKDQQLAKNKLAYIPDDCLIDPMQTGSELLEQTAKRKNTVVSPGVINLAHDFGLKQHLDKRFEQMSTGTRRKIYLTAAALGNPAVVIADGPDNGLDKESCELLAEVFKFWAADRVVLFASYNCNLINACGAQEFNLQV